MKLRCVECTLSGALRLDTGNFSVVLDNESDDGLQLIDEVYLRFTASRLSAFMSFELELPSQFKYPFTAHLPSISLGGVTVRFDLSLNGRVYTEQSPILDCRNR